MKWRDSDWAMEWDRGDIRKKKKEDIGYVGRGIIGTFTGCFGKMRGLGKVGLGRE